MMAWDSEPDEKGMHKIPVARKTARRIGKVSLPGESPNDTLHRVLDRVDVHPAPMWQGKELRGIEVFREAGGHGRDERLAEFKIDAALQDLKPGQRAHVLSKAQDAFAGKGYRVEVGDTDTMVEVDGHRDFIPDAQFKKALDDATKQRDRRADLAAHFATPVLQKLDESFWHKITEAWANGTAFHLFEEHLTVKAEPTFLAVPKVLQSFVVQHDWSAAFEKATDFEGGEFRLPYEAQVFEFRVSGRRVAVSVIADGGAPISAMLYLEFAGGFILAGMYRWEHGAWAFAFRELVDCVAGVMDLCGRQIRAVAIALEAKVATTDVVRAPHKLNAARERKGKPPLLDFHTISLARRVRAAAPLEHAAGDRAKVRLHFRRGHWRHFATSKTWINWMLVGDPELGFIDKHYRL